MNSNPTGCGSAEYTSALIWFGSTQPTKLIVNDKIVGEYNQYGFKGSHGVLLSWQINRGDKVCVEIKPQIEFLLNFGPDVEIQYDSYCSRSYCR